MFPDFWTFQCWEPSVKIWEASFDIGEGSLFPPGDPTGTCLVWPGGGWSDLLCKWVLHVQLSLAMGLRPLSASCHSLQTQGVPGALWSMWCAVSMLERTESRAPLVSQLAWLLELSSVKEAFSVSLRNHLRHRGSWPMENPLLGSPYTWKSSPSWRRAEALWMCGATCRRRRLCGAKHTTFDEVYLDSGKKFVGMSVMQGALRIQLFTKARCLLCIEWWKFADWRTANHYVGRIKIFKVQMGPYDCWSKTSKLGLDRPFSWPNSRPSELFVNEVLSLGVSKFYPVLSWILSPFTQNAPPSISDWIPQPLPCPQWCLITWPAFNKNPIRSV